MVLFAQRIKVKGWWAYCQTFGGSRIILCMAAAMESTPQPIDPRVAVAEEILALMGRTRTRQNTLARAIGISQPSLSKRLSGQHPFDLDELTSIAAYFGVEISDLLAGLRTGSFATSLTCLDIPIGQGSLLDTDLSPLDFYSRPELTSV